ELDWIIGCSYRGLPKEKSSVRNPIGANMSFRSEVLRKVGYFKSDIGRMGTTLLSDEETEISMRILKAIPKAKLIYDPSAIVHHKVDTQRTSLTYVWKRSFYEGISKATITADLNLATTRTALTTESDYLKYLIHVAIPSRARRILNPKSILQLLTLLTSTSAVFLGYISHMRGRL
ncbi:MAG: glycosyltransferase family 2 protein, partial [Candidatus Bathyarchaeota archaeon]